MFKVLDEVCRPTKGSEYSACIDLYARKDVVVGAGETVKVPLGICIDFNNLSRDQIVSISIPMLLKLGFPQDKLSEALKSDAVDLNELKEEFKRSHYIQIEPRSSLRAKGIQAGTGIIDLDYEDEIMIILHSNRDICIKKGQKIAQIMLCEHKSYFFGIESGAKRIGGFGSSGE